MPRLGGGVKGVHAPLANSSDPVFIPVLVCYPHAQIFRVTDSVGKKPQCGVVVFEETVTPRGCAPSTQ